MHDEPRMEQRWLAGMLAGLCGVLAVVVWERTAFAGLLDFAGEYRAEGPFPELHTGGGDVHAYLVLAMPFVVAWIVLRPTLFRVVAGTALFIAGELCARGDLRARRLRRLRRRHRGARRCDGDTLATARVRGMSDASSSPWSSGWPVSRS